MAALSFTSTHIVQLYNYKVYVDMLLTLSYIGLSKEEDPQAKRLPAAPDIGGR